MRADNEDLIAARGIILAYVPKPDTEINGFFLPEIAQDRRGGSVSVISVGPPAIGCSPEQARFLSRILPGDEILIGEAPSETSSMWVTPDVLALRVEDIYCKLADPTPN